MKQQLKNRIKRHGAAVKSALIIEEKYLYVCKQTGKQIIHILESVSMVSINTEMSWKRDLKEVNSLHCATNEIYKNET